MRTLHTGTHSYRNTHTVQAMTVGWNYEVKHNKADKGCEMFAPGGTQDIYCRSITQA